jgi:hypothetical protein
MKKLLIVSALLIFVFSVNAQIGVGFKAGINLANMTIKNNGKNVDTKMRKGLYLGAIVDISMSKMLSLQPGLFFSQKVVFFEDTYDDIGIELGGNNKLKINYLEIPINMVLKLGKGKAKYYLNAGPTIGYAINGKTIGEISTSFGSAIIPMSSEGEPVEFGSDIDQIKRMDLGLNVGAGLHLGAFIIGTSYNLGLTNLVNGENCNLKNRVINFSIGLLFGLK